MSDLLLVFILVTTLWTFFGYVGWKITKGEHILFRMIVWCIFGYFGTLTSLQTLVGLAEIFGWVF